MSERISDEELVRMIAEKLEPFSTLPNPEHRSVSPFGRDSQHGAWVCTLANDGIPLKRKATHVWMPQDMVNDPAMTVKLLEKLHDDFGNVALCGDNGWGVTVCHIDENGVETVYTRPSLTNSQTIGRAVAEAWALAMGLHSG